MKTSSLIGGVALIAGVAVFAIGVFIGGQFLGVGSETGVPTGVGDRGADQRLQARATSSAAEAVPAAAAAAPTSTPRARPPSTAGVADADTQEGAEGLPRNRFREIKDYVDWQERERDAREAGARELQAIMQAMPKSDGIGEEVAQGANTPEETYAADLDDPLQTEFWVPAERASDELAMELVESVHGVDTREAREAFEQMIEASRSAEASLEAPNIDAASDPVAAVKAGL